MFSAYINLAKSFLDEAESFRPVVKKGVETFKSFGPEINDLVESVVMAMVDLRAKSVRRLENEHGFTTEQAIFLVMDEWYAIARQARANNKGGK
jgi:hypothetical protein